MLPALTLIALIGHPAPPSPPPLPPTPIWKDVQVVACPPAPHLRLWPPEPRYRPDPWPYHRKTTPYVGAEVGTLAWFPGKGSAFRLLRPTVWTAGYYGWNFNPFVGVETSVGGTPLDEQDDGLGPVRRAGIAHVGANLKVRLVQPAPSSRVVPLLQVGGGAYWLAGRRDHAQGCRGKSCLLAYGGGVHAGAGLDIYLFRGGLLGLRVIYRHLFMTTLRCPAGSACAARVAGRKREQLPSLTATAHFTIFWSHR